MAGSQMAHVKKAINGNTFLADVNGAETKIRLVGVATPDPNDKTPILKKLGEQASEYLGEFLKNDWVYMEYPNGQATPDADGVIDAFVYHQGKETVMVNEKIIAEGYGIANRKVKTLYSGTLEEAEKNALRFKKGVWSPLPEMSAKEAANSVSQPTYLGEVYSGDRYSSWGYGGYSSSQVVRTWILSYR